MLTAFVGNWLYRPIWRITLGETSKSHGKVMEFDKLYLYVYILGEHTQCLIVFA